MKIGVEVKSTENSYHLSTFYIYMEQHLMMMSVGVLCYEPVSDRMNSAAGNKPDQNKFYFETVVLPKT